MAPLTSKGKSWEVANSFWMIWSWLPFVGFISFLYIGLRVKQKKWLIWGAIYFIPWIMAFVLPDATNPDVDSWQGDLWVACVLLAWVGGAFHTFRVRKEYLLRRAAIEELRWKEAQELKNRIEMEYDVDLDKPMTKQARQTKPEPPKSTDPPARPREAGRQRVMTNDADQTAASASGATSGASGSAARAASDAEARTRGLEQELQQQQPESGLYANSRFIPDAQQEDLFEASRHVQSAKDPQDLGDPQESDFPASQRSETSLPLEPVDLNKATESQLAQIPGIGSMLAMRAVSEREVRGGFRSVEEFVAAIGLRSEQADRIRPYAYVIPK